MDPFLISGCEEESKRKVDPRGLVGPPATSSFLSEAGTASSSPISFTPSVIEEGHEASTPFSTPKASTKLVSYSSNETSDVSINGGNPFVSASLNGEGWADSSQNIPQARRRRRQIPSVLQGCSFGTRIVLHSSDS